MPTRQIDRELKIAVKAQLCRRRLRLEKEYRDAQMRGSFFPPQFLDQLIWATKQLDLGHTILAVRELYRDLRKDAPAEERTEVRRLIAALPQEWQVAPENSLSLEAEGGLHSEEEAKLFAAAWLRKQGHPPLGHLFLIGPDGKSQEFGILG